MKVADLIEQLIEEMTPFSEFDTDDMYRNIDDIFLMDAIRAGFDGTGFYIRHRHEDID